MIKIAITVDTPAQYCDLNQQFRCPNLALLQSDILPSHATNTYLILVKKFCNTHPIGVTLILTFIIYAANKLDVIIICSKQ